MGRKKKGHKHGGYGGHGAHSDHRKSKPDDDYNLLCKQLTALGLRMKDVRSDGNCLFRALSDQMDDDGGRNHAAYRHNIVKFISENPDEYQPFVTDETLESYCSKMMKEGAWGGNLEIVATMRALKVTIVVHMPGNPRWVVQYPDDPVKVLQVAYLHGQHYTSVVQRNLDESVDVELLTSGVVKKEEEKKDDVVEEDAVSTPVADLSVLNRQERRRTVREQRKLKKLNAEKKKMEKIKIRMGVKKKQAEEKEEVEQLEGDMGALHI